MFAAVVLLALARLGCDTFGLLLGCFLLLAVSSVCCCAASRTAFRSAVIFSRWLRRSGFSICSGVMAAGS